MGRAGPAPSTRPGRASNGDVAAALREAPGDDYVSTGGAIGERH